MTTIKLTNQSEIPLPLAAVLADKLINSPKRDINHITATTLIKPTRALAIYRKSFNNQEEVLDINSVLNTILGTSLHNSMENIWKDKKALKTALISILDDEAEADRLIANTFVEVRSSKQVGEFTISGQFDCVMDGQLYDLKSTSTFTYTTGAKEKDYILQGSIYKWLNPELITGNHINIIYFFTDFKQALVGTKDYPPSRVVMVSYPLMGVFETTMYITQKLDAIKNWSEKDWQDIPQCSDIEKGITESKWSYFSSSDSLRASKNFDNAFSATAHMQSKGKGFIKEVKGKAVNCQFCFVKDICNQVNGEL